MEALLFQRLESKRLGRNRRRKLLGHRLDLRFITCVVEIVSYVSRVSMEESRTNDEVFMMIVLRSYCLRTRFVLYHAPMLCRE